MENKRSICSWYKNHAFSLYSSLPWIRRGGSFYTGNESGIFSFANDSGDKNANLSFRIILSP